MRALRPVFLATILTGIFCLGSKTIIADTNKGEPSEAFLKYWDGFVNSIQKKDTVSFRKFSLDCIHCVSCVSNTDIEDSLNNVLREQDPDLWHDKTSKELSYVPINKFVSEDFKIVFNNNVSARLTIESKIAFRVVPMHHDFKTNSPACIVDAIDNNSLEIQEVFLTVKDPEKYYEAKYMAFQFIKTKTGYKFIGVRSVH